MGVWTAREERSNHFDWTWDYCSQGKHVGYVAGGIHFAAFGAPGRILVGGLLLKNAQQAVENFEASVDLKDLPECPHPEGHSPYVIEAHQALISGTSFVYSITVSKDGHDPDLFTFATPGAFQNFLLGFRVALVTENYPAHELLWPSNLPDGFAIRWRISRDGIFAAESIEPIRAGRAS